MTIRLKKLSILFALLFSLIESPAAYCKEYINLENYLKENPAGKHDGKDGNWLKADRLKNTQVWNDANQINIRLDKGFKEYNDIAERSDFYVWFQNQTAVLGFETKWSYAAAITTKKLEKLLTNGAKLSGISNHEICDFVTIGNRVIFDDIWKDLKSLYENQPLKKDTAEIWDGNLLLKEQNLIEAYYQKLSPSSLNKLEKLLRKENFFSRLMPGYEFEGNLLNIRDRWYYGMKMMRYQNPKFP